MALFGLGKSNSAPDSSGGRRDRYSSGWTALSDYLRSQESLRVLDFGPTSAGNINFITTLGHSIYMANLVEDAARPEYIGKEPDGSPVYRVDEFLRQNLEFAGRSFEVVTLWDTLDYLPAELTVAVVDRLFEVMVPGGKLLAFFHAKNNVQDNQFYRYHLTGTDQLNLQSAGMFPLLQTFNTRQIEQLFVRYSAYKFFLAKDALREVIVTR